MNVSLSIAVMAHSARGEWAGLLAAELDAPIVWDNGRGVWSTGRRALLAHDPDATHHLVVQDDAVICRELVAGLEVALSYAGHRAVGLYTGSRPDRTRIAKAGRTATEMGVSWISTRHWPLWGVASAHPVDMIGDLVASGDTMGRPTRYDLQTRHFYRNAGVAVWYTWPSLVDHRDGPSLLENPDGRRAQRFIGEDVSALSVDWSTPPYVVN